MLGHMSSTELIELSRLLEQARASVGETATAAPREEAQRV